MKTLKTIVLAAVCSSILSITSFADEFGTKEEAAALLDRAVALLRVDKNRALDLFTTGDGGLIQKDLYVFCGSPDGTLTAHPNGVGLSLLDYKDSEGTPVGELAYANAKTGKVFEITYKFLKPTTDSEKEYTKTAMFTKVAGQVCGVGYYHPE